MTDLDKALNRIIELLVIGYNVSISFQLKDQKEDEHGVRSDVYYLSVDDISFGKVKTIRITADNGLAVATWEDDAGATLSFPVELTRIPNFQDFLNRYRSTELWEIDEPFVCGLLEVPLMYDEFDNLFLAVTSAEFELDKISKQQLQGKEEEIIHDLDLVARWHLFIRKCSDKVQTPEEDRVVRQAAAFIVNSFADWDATYMELVLSLCTLDGGLYQLAIKFPDAFPDC